MPARAPHFGGLWEAAVRSLKLLLKKTLGERLLNFEQLTTLVAAAEAVLNSRPLIPLNSLADDAIEPLTPGHFLVGGPLVALPSIPDTRTKICNLRGWNLVLRLSYNFWVRWKSEYLVELQRRAKWKTPNREMEIGDIVLMKDHDSFHKSWPMGKITQVYPGKDNHVRVVDVFSNGRTFRRPIAKLAVLHKDETDSALYGGVCSGVRPRSSDSTAMDVGGPGYND